MILNILTHVLLSFLVCNVSLAKDSPLSSYSIPAKLNVIFDGDTISVSVDKAEVEVVELLCSHPKAKVFNCDNTEKEHITFNVRLYRTDSPEVKAGSIVDQSELGTLAKDALSLLLETSETIYIKPGVDSIGPFGRLLGEVFLEDGLNVNMEMVLRGWSVPFIYEPVERDTYLAYTKAGLEALESKRGLYSHEHIDKKANIPPHEARLMNKKRTKSNGCYLKSLPSDNSVLIPELTPIAAPGFYEDQLFPDNQTRHKLSMKIVFYSFFQKNCRP